MPMPFSPKDTVVLTSTISNQSVTLPPGATTMMVYNAAANPVYLRLGSAAAVPGSTFPQGPIMVVQPGTTQMFSIAGTGMALNYIAATAGGALVVSVGDGE